MTLTFRCMLVILAGAFGVAVSPTQARAQDAAPAPVREITLLRGDLYRVHAGGQVAVFLVTPTGIILADPLNYDTAVWLRKELETRVPDRPVRYVLHTHHHFDRAEGASVFNDTAELVGHRSFSNELSASRVSTASHLASLDRNEDGVFERDELVGDAISAEIAARDRNADGRITLDELYRRVRDVETIFNGRRTIVLGGHSVELIHTGGSHSADMTALHFVSERVVFATDHVPIATPFSFGTLRPKEAVEWVRTISSLDFDMLISGDGSSSARSEIAALGEYFNDLVASAMAGYELGLSVDELKTVSSLGAKYTGPRYSLRDANIAQVFQHVGTIATDIYGGALMGYARPSSSLCPYFLDECTPPKNPLSSSILGLRLSGRGIGGAVEVRTQQQSTYFTRYRFSETTSAHRETRVSIMARVNLSTRDRSRLAVVGGPAFSFGHTKNVSFRREGVVPDAGPTLYGWSEVAFGFTYGIETGLSLGDRASLMLPARITVLKRGRDSALGSVEAYAGVGVTLKLFRTTFLK